LDEINIVGSICTIEGTNTEQTYQGRSDKGIEFEEIIMDRTMNFRADTVAHDRGIDYHRVESRERAVTRAENTDGFIKVRVMTSKHAC
jgi:hypothetical protein